MNRLPDTAARPDGADPAISADDLEQLAAGVHVRPYAVLGAHLHSHKGVAGTRFAVWAPNALQVSVVGDFNSWDDQHNPMRLHATSGVWQTYVPGVQVGALYKFAVRDAQGQLLPLRADPYARESELRPATASIVAAMPVRQAASGPSRSPHGRGDPVSIYEVHLGSWRRIPDANHALGRWPTWDELADQLIPYAVDMGFTHLEFLPVSEHPFDGSWGYQPVGLYAPTARFGEPGGLRRLIKRCHAAGLGVLLDWVPAHFPTDPHGLAQFDGTALYEYADPREGFHPDWNTLIYNLCRPEVASFLLGNALYWLECFGADGLRVDAVASMLYRDYSRQPDAWIPNVHGGRENLESMAFLQRLHAILEKERPQAMTAAEESTTFPGVTRPAPTGGLGFTYKWNMGWMHDTLQYMARDPIHRKYHHNELTFGLSYAFDENFILPLSHDEVVHGKGSLLNKMPGERWQKFANLRAYLGFMFAHPGKKLLFMGAEFAQEREWNHDAALDWHLLEQPEHAGVQRLVRDLNHLYRATPALHSLDCEAQGFEWIDLADADQSVVSFLRRAPSEDPGFVVVVCNFTPNRHAQYRIGVPQPGQYVQCLSTDAAQYGGTALYFSNEASPSQPQPQPQPQPSSIGTSANRNPAGITASATPCHDRPYSIVLALPPLSTLFLQWTPLVSI